MRRNRENLNKVVIQGRNPKLMIMADNHRLTSLKEIGYSMIDLIEKHAKAMGSPYLEAINLQRQKLESVEHTPSAQIISQSCTSYQAWLMQQSQKHYQSLLSYKIPEAIYSHLQHEAKQSQTAQKHLEQNDYGDIENYIKDYYRLNKCPMTS